MTNCDHARWVVRDNDQVEWAFCTDCNSRVDILEVLNGLARRVDECTRMVAARLGRRVPVPTPTLTVVGGRAIEEEPQ